MSDPRRRIAEHRDALVPPPRTDSRPVLAEVAPPPSNQEAPARCSTMIGKQQGRLRCVGLYLSAPDADGLRSMATSEGVALGVALIRMLNRSFDAVAERWGETPVGERFPTAARRTTRRGLDKPSIVYVLLDPIEAAAVKAAADSLGLSVSDLAGKCISTDSPRGSAGRKYRADSS